MKKYLKLMRVHHYMKNGLVFLPLIFSGQLIYGNQLWKSILGFLAFSFAASIVYIINDIQDVENDRKHEIKSKRPLAAGVVSLSTAWRLAGFLVLLVISFNYLSVGANIKSWIYLLLYIILNLFYSYGLKDKPLIDIAILVSGFILRVLYGSEIIDVQVSNWLYLTIISLSFYLGLGKRRNEIKYQGNSTRKVLQHYNHDFLDKNMYMCLAISIVFYSLWCVDPRTIARLSNDMLVWTVPLVMLICMKYSLNIEGESQGDPVEVVLGDKILMALISGYGLLIVFIIYGFTL